MIHWWWWWWWSIGKAYIFFVLHLSLSLSLSTYMQLLNCDCFRYCMDVTAMCCGCRGTSDYILLTYLIQGRCVYYQPLLCSLVTMVEKAFLSLSLSLTYLSVKAARELGLPSFGLSYLLSSYCDVQTNKVGSPIIHTPSSSV